MHYTTSYAYYELALRCFVEKDDDGSGGSRIL